MVYKSKEDSEKGKHADPFQSLELDGHELQPLGFNGSSTKVCPRDGKIGCSILDTLDRRHRGRAGVFVSWVWRYTASTMMTALWRMLQKMSVEDVFVWCCFFDNNQNRIIVSGEVQGSDDLSDIFVKRLKAIGKMVIILDAWKDPVYAKRIWTVYETFEADRNAVDIDVAFSDHCDSNLEQFVECTPLPQIIEQMALSVDVEKAEAWEKQDELNIKKKITDEHGHGGFKTVDFAVQHALLNAMKVLLDKYMDKGLSGMCGKVNKSL